MTLFGSLASRIYGVAALTAAAALLLGGLLLHNSARSREEFGWVNHTQEVLLTVDSLQATLREAESGLRGYILTHETRYLGRFDVDLALGSAHVRRLAILVRDNPAQQVRAARLGTLASAKIRLMRAAVDRARAASGGHGPNRQGLEQGRSLMDQIGAVAATMRDSERRLLADRIAAADGQIRQARALLLYGCPLLALLIAGIAGLIRTSISRPLADLLDVVTRFGAGDRQARATTRLRSTEFKRLAFAYNDMADRLVVAMEQQSSAEDKLGRANAELVELGIALEARQLSVQLMSETAHRLQAIQSEGELAEVLDCFLPKVLPDVAGALYVHNHSRNMLTRIASWGDPLAAPETFAPAECWGLRRGKPHVVASPGADLMCGHANGPFAVERLCQPVLAGGEVLGLLYLEGAVTGEHAFRLGMLMENVALALVNENLRSRLREQSIRDPLTKLFNRRYMEEALALETARAERAGTELTVVMCDIDHFKRFNDGNGHEAGDVLLAAVAGLIQRHFRHGDIVCRYGGEEFTVIAPGTSRTAIGERLEMLRLAVRELLVDYHGQRLGPVTMSFGVDSWSADEDRPPHALVGEADKALFRAKRLGRDRVELAAPAVMRAAAE